MAPFAGLAPDVLVRRHSRLLPPARARPVFPETKEEKKNLSTNSSSVQPTTKSPVVSSLCRPSSPTRLPPYLRAAFEVRDRAERARASAWEVHQSNAGGANASLLHDDGDNAFLTDNNINNAVRHNKRFHHHYTSRAGLITDDDDDDDDDAVHLGIVSGEGNRTGTYTGVDRIALAKKQRESAMHVSSFRSAGLLHRSDGVDHDQKMQRHRGRVERNELQGGSSIVGITSLPGTTTTTTTRDDPRRLPSILLPLSSVTPHGVQAKMLEVAGSSSPVQSPRTRNTQQVMNVSPHGGGGAIKHSHVGDEIDGGGGSGRRTTVSRVKVSRVDPVSDRTWNPSCRPRYADLTSSSDEDIDVSGWDTSSSKMSTRAGSVLRHPNASTTTVCGVDNDSWGAPGRDDDDDEKKRSSSSTRPARPHASWKSSNNGSDNGSKSKSKSKSKSESTSRSKIKSASMGNRDLSGRMIFVSDLLTPGQLGGGTFSGALERMDIRPEVDRVQSRRFAFPALSAVMKRNQVDEEAHRRRRRRRTSRACSRASDEACAPAAARTRDRSNAHDNMSSAVVSSAAGGVGDIVLSEDNASSTTPSPGQTRFKPPLVIKVELPDIHSSSNGSTCSSNSGGGGGGGCSRDSTRDTWQVTGVADEKKICRKTVSKNEDEDEEEPGDDTAAVVGGDKDATDVGVKHWGALRDSVAANGGFGGAAVGGEFESSKNVDLLDEMRDASWDTLMLFGGGGGGGLKPGKGVLLNGGKSGGPPGTSASGGYKYNSKSDARYMNRHRRVENVDLAVKLIGKVQSRSQFWKGFTPEECKLMGAEVEIIRYKATERIMRTGDQADFVALILSGGARVEVNAPATGEKRTAGVFGPGSLIGEMALWEGGTRSADVIATGGGVSGAGGISQGIGGGEASKSKSSSSSSSSASCGILSSAAAAAKEEEEVDDPGETLVAQFHFDEFVEFFLRHPPVAMKLFQVFVQASTSKLKEWRLRTMIAHRAMSQGAGAGAFVGVGGGGAGTGSAGGAPHEKSAASSTSSSSSSTTIAGGGDDDGGANVAEHEGRGHSPSSFTGEAAAAGAASVRETRPVLVHSIPSKRVLDLLREAHGAEMRLSLLCPYAEGQELSDVDLTWLSRRLQIVGGSEGVRILEAGQLAGSLVIVLQGAAQSWRGGYRGGQMLSHHGPGDMVNVEEYIESFHGPHEQTADVISVEPSTVCALLTVPNLLDLNAAHPVLVFKIICHAGETLVSRLSRQLKALKAAAGGAGVGAGGGDASARGAGGSGAAGGAAGSGSDTTAAARAPTASSSPRSQQQHEQQEHTHEHPTFLRKVVGRWRESQVDYLPPSAVDEDTVARLQAVTGGGGGDGSSSPSSMNDSPRGGARRGGGGSRGRKRGERGADANNSKRKNNKKIQTGEALFDHYTGEFEFDAAQVASGDNRLHPLLGGRSPAELLHDVISFSPVFRGFSDREISQLADRMSLVGVAAGRQIIRQGQDPTFVGLMVQGSASVVNLEGDVVAALGPGTIIGEIALFEGGVRQATVVSAEDDTLVGAFTFEDLVALAMNKPLLGLKVLMLCVRSAGARVHDNIVHVSPREDFFAADDDAADGVDCSRDVQAADENRAAGDEVELHVKVDGDGPGGGSTTMKEVEEAHHQHGAVERDDDKNNSCARKNTAKHQEPREEDAAGKANVTRNDDDSDGGDEKRERERLAVAKALRAAHAAAAEISSNPAAAGGLTEDIKDGDIDTLSEYARIRRFAPGQEVISEGQVGCAVLFITEGAMDVRVGGRRGALLETKFKGEYVGEAAYLEHGAGGISGGGGGGGGGGTRGVISTASDPGSIRRRRRTADVIAGAASGASAAVITYEALDRLSADHPLLAMAVFTRMATLAMARWRRALSSVELGGSTASDGAKVNSNGGGGGAGHGGPGPGSRGHHHHQGGRGSGRQQQAMGPPGKGRLNTGGGGGSRGACWAQEDGASKASKEGLRKAIMYKRVAATTDKRQT